MNKKYLIYSVLVMFLMMCNSSFSMYRWIFRGAKTIGKVTVTVVGGAFAYKQNKDYEKVCQDIDVSVNNLESVINNAPRRLFGGIQVSDKPVPVEVEKWMRKKMEKIGGSSLQTLPIILVDGKFPAAALGRKILFIGTERAEELNRVLQDETHNPNEIIDENAAILKHELKHIIKDDTKKIMCALGLIPVTVETVCSGVTHAFNKRYGIEAPKTFLKTAFRSSVAVGSVVPKLMFSLLGMSFYKRYEETAADKFACENAETREELEAFANFFNKRENPDWATKNRLEVRLLEARKDPIHPAPVDRREMVESYIAKWDAEHSNEKKA